MKRAAFLLPLWAAFAVVLLAPLDAQAQDRRVIQNRSYTVNHEFTLQMGVLPLDVLYKAPTITGRYTWHINDYVAWEVLSLTYAPTTDLSLIGLGFGPLRFNHFTSQGNELQENFGYRPFDIDQMRMFAESNFVLTPLYGKFSLFNRANARLELYALGGFALANFVAYQPYPFDPLSTLPDPPSVPTPGDFIPRDGDIRTFVLRPGVDIGGGTRLFVNRWLSLRLDGRAYGFLEGYNCTGTTRWFCDPRLLPGAVPSTRELPQLPLSFTQVLYVGAGMSVSLGGYE